VVDVVLVVVVVVKVEVLVFVMVIVDVVVVVVVGYEALEQIMFRWSCAPWPMCIAPGANQSWPAKT